MYKLNSEIELSAEQVDRIRRGYFAMLARRRFKPDFIENHADDVLAKAHLEYVRCAVKGVEIEDPITWTIHCAWRRAQTFVAAPKNSREVTAEKLPELEDREAPTTEQLAEDQHRAREIRRAVDSLRKQEQQIIALTYLEDMTLREAARQLDWPLTTARRRFKSAMERLEDFFEERGIESSDELEIGLAAFLASTCHSPGFLEVAVEKTGDAVAIAWEKAHDLPRRVFLGGGGDAASVAATSGAGRAAGACATVAIACVVGAGASGVVGPGIDGGIGLVSGHHSEPKKVQSETATTPRPLETSPVESTESEASTAAAPSETETQDSNPSATTAAAKKSAPIRVREQTDAAARISSESAGQEVQSAPPATATSSSVQSGSAGSSRSSTTHTAAPSNRSEEQAAQQFGGP